MSDAQAIDLAARRAVEDVHARRGQQLFGFARRLGLRDDEAEEVVQEALLRLWQSLAQGDRVTEPSAWTFRATYRLAMDRHRWQRRWQRLVEAYSTDRGDRVAVAEPPDDGLAVWAEVDRLPPRQRAAVYLRYRADLDFEAVGRVLGIDASSARGNVARGVAKIRARLAAPEECAEVAR